MSVARYLDFDEIEVSRKLATNWIDSDRYSNVRDPFSSVDSGRSIQVTNFHAGDHSQIDSILL